MRARSGRATFAGMDIVAVDQGRGRIVRSVLTLLPGWFGIESARETYIRQAEGLPMFATFDGRCPVGYLSLDKGPPKGAEIASMGVLPDVHRRGIGRGLVAAAAAFAESRGDEALFVKTLAPSHPDPNYAATRAFYAGVGFCDLRDLPGEWGPDLPCLLMMRPLAGWRGGTAPSS